MKPFTLSQFKTILPAVLAGAALALGFQNCGRQGVASGDGVATGVASATIGESFDPLKAMASQADANGFVNGPAFELSRIVHREGDAIAASAYTPGAFTLQFTALATDIADDGSADVALKNLTFQASSTCHLSIAGTGKMARAHGQPLKIGALTLAADDSRVVTDASCNQNFSDEDQKLLANNAYRDLLAQVSAYAVMDGELHLFLNNGDEVTFSRAVASSSGSTLTYAQATEALASGLRAVQIVKPTPCADTNVRSDQVCAQVVVTQNLSGHVVFKGSANSLQINGSCSVYVATLAERAANANENLPEEAVPVVVSNLHASANAANCNEQYALELETLLQLVRNVRSISGSTTDMFLVTAAGSRIELKAGSADSNSAQ